MSNRMTSIWTIVKQRAADGDRPPAQRTRRRGRVLRVKDGYNPNSSSVGSAMPTFLAFAAGIGGLAVLLLNLRSVVGGLIREHKTSDAGKPDARPSDAEQDDGGEEA